MNLVRTFFPKIRALFFKFRKRAGEISPLPSSSYAPVLSIIAELEPQSAYSASVGGFKGKLTYFMDTIPSLRELLKPLEDFARINYIPAITGGHLCSHNELILLSFPVRFGGLAI